MRGAGVGVGRGAIAVLRRGRESWGLAAETRLEPVTKVVAKSSASAIRNLRFFKPPGEFLLSFINPIILIKYKLNNSACPQNLVSFCR